MTDAAFKAMSVEEYLRTEKTSAFKREDVNGVAYPLHRPLAQAGTTDAHATISGNTFAALRLLARRQGGFAYASDMHVTTADRHTSYYPDVRVTCEPRDDAAKSKAAPCILAGVLSKSTAHTDHNAKYHAYTALPSLQSYLLVEQDERRVYACVRGDAAEPGGGWTLHEYDAQDSISLPCLDADLPLNDIYEDVRPIAQDA